MFTLVIAEKPHIASRSAVALGGNGKTRYAEYRGESGFDGNRYSIFWGIGHLFEVCDPQIDRNIFAECDVE